MEALAASYGPIIDSLPYLPEAQYDDSVGDEVHKLIETEMSQFAPRDYLEKYPEVIPFQHISENQAGSMVAVEFKRLVDSGAINSERIDVTRYRLPPPPVPNDLNAWKDCLNNANTQLEHQYLRLSNLERMDMNGVNLWKEHISYLETLSKRMKMNLEQLTKKIEALNLQRKSEQLHAGATLSNLKATWTALIYKNLEIERACAALEQEIAQHKKHNSNHNSS